MAREMVQACLDACGSYDLPSEDYIRVVASVRALLEKYKAEIHGEVADFLETEADALKAGFKGKEAQLIRVVLDGFATAVRNRK